MLQMVETEKLKIGYCKSRKPTKARVPPALNRTGAPKRAIDGRAGRDRADRNDVGNSNAGDSPKEG